MGPAADADRGAVPMDVVYFKVVFAEVSRPRVVDHKFVLLLLQQRVESTQFGDSIEEDDHLRFGLYLGQLLEDVEDDGVFVFGLGVEVTDALQPLVFIRRIQLHDVVTHQAALDELPEVLLVSSRRSNQELTHGRSTLALEAPFLGFEKKRSISETSSRASSLSMSHSSRTTHLSSDRSKVLGEASLVWVLKGIPTITCPNSNTVL